MKLLKWAETIKQPAPVSKEDILNRVEKDEIVHLAVTGLYAIMSFSGLMVILLAQRGSKPAWLGLAVIVVSSAGYLESTIKGYLKLERYKAIWDKLDIQQSELRQMQTKDL